jgi:hypothetical protein
MELEDILKVIETAARLRRNKEEYLFSIFGTPGAQGPLGLARRRTSRVTALRDRRLGDDQHVSQLAMFLGIESRGSPGRREEGLRVLAAKKMPPATLGPGSARRSAEAGRSSTQSHPAKF